ncbi:MAG: xanthine dehydrogenase, partial [Oscillospiraceae bacterium]|nr:xanthine dehydrogenase [Oscillospiraceae bacterium]
LIVKKTPGEVVYTAMRNQRTDFPVITCALSNIGGEYRAVIGARPAKAVVIRDELGLMPDGKAFAAYVAENAPVDSNIRGNAAYRTHLIRVLVERAAKELGGM